VSQEDAGRGSNIESVRAAESSSLPWSPRLLAAEEKAVLEILVDCKSARTVTQLSTSSGLGREVVALALESLRGKGLVSRFNTLVESFAARFPGVEV
jgi:hypothetical protein